MTWSVLNYKDAMPNFFKRIGVNPLDRLKIHISISPVDYKNQEIVTALETLLSCAHQDATLLGYKLANTESLNEEINDALLINDYLTSEDHLTRSLESHIQSVYEKKTSEIGLHALIRRGTSYLNGLIRHVIQYKDLNKSLAKTSLEKWDKTSLTSLLNENNEIIKSNQRFVTGEQFTLYVNESKLTEIAELIVTIELLLIKANVSAGSFHPANRIIAIPVEAHRFFSLRAQTIDGTKYLDCSTDSELQQQGVITLSHIGEKLYHMLVDSSLRDQLMSQKVIAPS